MVQLGSANAVWDKYINKCPHCGKYTYLQVGDEGGCKSCGYNNVPHAGTHQKVKRLIKAKDPQGNEIDLPDVEPDHYDPYQWQDLQRKRQFKGYTEPRFYPNRQERIGHKGKYVSERTPGMAQTAHEENVNDKMHDMFHNASPGHIHYEPQDGEFVSEWEHDYSDEDKSDAAETLTGKAQECPRCEAWSLYQHNDGEVYCTECGYHNFPHGGSHKKMKKAWEEYASMKKFAPMLAAAAAQEAGKVVQAPMKAATDIFEHAAAIGHGGENAAAPAPTSAAVPAPGQKQPQQPQQPGTPAVVAPVPPTATKKKDVDPNGTNSLMADAQKINATAGGFNKAWLKYKRQYPEK